MTIELFSHASLVFPVKNIEQSLSFYTESLGFDVSFTWGEPVEYAVIGRGNVKIHLSKRSDDRSPSDQHTALYIFVHDVDAVFDEFSKKGIATINAPMDHDYKMRDFDLKDPDGYILTFGKGE